MAPWATSVVHGGKSTHSVIVTPEVISNLEDYSELAPLHNPAALKGYLAIKKNLPEVKQVFVYDTAFHQTMPDYAYTYALPYDICEKYKIRRYGFHGTSHRFVSQRAAEFLNWDITTKKIITCHIGNGASITAIDGGKVVDTSMGLTPLEGLVMGTRSGDVDPSIVTFLMDHMANQRAGNGRHPEQEIRHTGNVGRIERHARDRQGRKRRQRTRSAGTQRILLPPVRANT